MPIHYTTQCVGCREIVRFMVNHIPKHTMTEHFANLMIFSFLRCRSLHQKFIMWHLIILGRNILAQIKQGWSSIYKDEAFFFFLCLQKLEHVPVTLFQKVISMLLIIFDKYFGTD